MKSFKIKKGKHYPNGFHFGLTFKKRVDYVCRFDKSCLYHFDDVDDYDINKLCGFSTTWFHHKQSARIGWRCIGGKVFEVLTYSYNDGKRELQEMDILGVVKPNQDFVVAIIDNEEYYSYVFGIISDPSSKTIAVDKKKKDWFPFNYLLFPYFGGNRTAPHDMTIYLEKLY